MPATSLALPRRLSEIRREGSVLRLDCMKKVYWYGRPSSAFLLDLEHITQHVLKLELMVLLDRASLC